MSYKCSVSSASDYVDGVVFEITQTELLKSDQYGVDAYQSIKGKFQSGQDAWCMLRLRNNERTF